MGQAVRIRMCNLTVRPFELHPSGRTKRPSGRFTL
jgi:hypothetical protein